MDKVLHKTTKRTGIPNLEANLFQSLLDHPCIMKAQEIYCCTDEKTLIRMELEFESIQGTSLYIYIYIYIETLGEHMQNNGNIQKWKY